MRLALASVLTLSIATASSVDLLAPSVSITTTSLPGGTVGVPYSQTLSAHSGRTPYTWSISSGALPSGLTLEGTTGVISGTPTSAGTSSFIVRVADANGASDTQPLQITIAAQPLAITTTALPSATVGVAYTDQLAASSGTAPYRWSVVSGALPNGITLSTAGALSGTPTAAGTFNFTAGVTDATGQTATVPLTLAVAPRLTVSTSSLPDGTVGTPYSAVLAATGGTGGFSWSITTGQLPQGLTLSTSGAITGAPTVSGTANFTVQVSDSSGATATKGLSIRVAPTTLAITTTSLPGGTVGAAYSQTLAATGGTGGYTWSVSSGSLPHGLSLSAAGTISGTPSTAGSSNFTARVADSSGAAATKPLSITVNPAPLTITTNSLPAGTVGTTYSQSLAASGGTGGYTWSVASGALPQGLSLSAAGTISGTPSTSGTANFTARVTDSSSATATQALSIAINPAALSITTNSLPAGTVGTAYSQSLAATGGTGGYTWAVASGSLPQGVSLSNAGTISGTPSTSGTANFTARVTDSSSATATKALSIVINPAALSVTTNSLPAGTVGAAYSQSLAASGGTGGNTWSVASGSLPQGLSLSAAGAISGTPSAAGNSNFTVRVTDSSGATANKALSIAVNPAALSITTNSLPAGIVGAAYSQPLTATGGTGGNTWSVASGSLPDGLSLSAAGSISGTPSTAGSANFTVRVADSSGASATKALSITVNPAALTITTNSLRAGTVGAPYSEALAATGGTGGYTWAVTSGTLPQGLSLNAGGMINGTPSTAGTSNFTVRVTDSGGATVTKSLSLAVNPAALAITTNSLPAAVVGAAYSQALTATGGSGGYTWSISSGTLPPGLSLSAAGGITGTPSAAGSFNLTVQVSDSSGTTASKPLSITVSPATLAITTTSLPAGTAGTAYSQSLGATGGTAPYTWAIISGSLPQGLSLSAGGAIAGTPAAAATASVTVQVSDQGGATASSQLSLTINPAPLAITSSSLPPGTAGAAYSQTLAATGGTGGYTWSVASGSLPQGLSLSAAGSLTGTPTAPGSSTITVRVADSSGATATGSLTISVQPAALVITTTSLLPATAGAPYQQSLAATGGSGTITWALMSGSLPQGLSLDPTGSIGGTPAQPGTFNFTLQAKDAASATAQRALALTVAPGVSVTTSSLPAALSGTPYSATVSATGGTPPYTWSITSGALPPGLSLSATGGGIAGTPGTPGTYNFVLQVTDSALSTATKPLTITVGASLTITTRSTLANGSLGAPYTQQLAARGGTQPYTWSVVTGALPRGLSLTPSNGIISGTPSQAGTFNFTVEVADAASGRVRGDFTITIATGLTIATPPQLSGASVPQQYTQTLEPAGGTPPYVWSITAGSLPAGLSFNAGGRISGTPTSAGTFTFTAEVVDGNGVRSSKQFTLVVAAALTITTAPALPPAATGAAYSQTLSAAGGTEPYLWNIVSGTIPPGLTLEPATGTLAGTPGATGTFSFTAEVADANSNRVQKQFSVAVTSGVTFSSAASLPGATAGTPYTFTLQASGGRPPYTWRVASGALPDGLALNATSGVISGNPTAPGTFNFAIEAADAGGLTATRVHSLVVGLPALPAVSITGLSDTIAPLQQPRIQVTFDSPFPVDVTGTLNMTFTPAGANPVDDPAVQFSTGGRSVPFTIPANTTQAVFPVPQFGIQSGSTAGSLNFTVDSLQAGGTPLGNGPVSRAVQMAAVAPSVRAVQVLRTAAGFQLQATGVTTTRELTGAIVRFRPRAGSDLRTAEVSIPLDAVSKTWFQDAASANFGGQFTLTLPFSIQGSADALDSVSITLSNGVGASTEVSALY